MIRRPPRSTRTDTLFPYTTLLRSIKGDVVGNRRAGWDRFFVAPHDFVVGAVPTLHRIVDSLALVGGEGPAGALLDEIHAHRGDREVVDRQMVGLGEEERSERRRAGEECVSTGRSRWSADH